MSIFPFGKYEYTLVFRQLLIGELQGFAVGGPPVYGYHACLARQPAEHRHLEDLGLGEDTNRAIQGKPYHQRIGHAKMVTDQEDGASGGYGSLVGNVKAHLQARQEACHDSYEPIAHVDSIYLSEQA
jgi:hypothetical protein